MPSDNPSAKSLAIAIRCYQRCRSPFLWRRVRLQPRRCATSTSDDHVILVNSVLVMRVNNPQTSFALVSVKDVLISHYCTAMIASTSARRSVNLVLTSTIPSSSDSSMLSLSAILCASAVLIFAPLQYPHITPSSIPVISAR